MDSLNKNENEENKSNMTLNKMKENIKNQTNFNYDLKKSMMNPNGINSLLGYEQNTNKFLFEDGYKSDDEENIQDQNDIYEFIGRKSIGELDNKEIEKDEILKENNSEKDNNINGIVEKWKYEKILLDNNIIDYNRK